MKNEKTNESSDQERTRPEDEIKAQQNEDNSVRFWWGELKPILIRILWGNQYLRFMTLVFMSGLGLLTPTILEMVLAQFQVVLPPEKEGTQSEISLQERVALYLITCGILGHILFHLTNLLRKYVKWRTRIMKNQLASRCESIASQFMNPKNVNPPGHLSEEIKTASTLAKRLSGRSDHEVFTHPAFAALQEPKIDASGEAPLFGTSAQELSCFAKKLRNSNIEE